MTSGNVHDFISIPPFGASSFAFLSMPLMNRLRVLGGWRFEGGGGRKASHFDYKYETCSHKYDELPLEAPNHRFPQLPQWRVYGVHLMGVTYRSEEGRTRDAKVKLILSQLESILSEWRPQTLRQSWDNN